MKIIKVRTLYPKWELKANLTYQKDLASYIDALSSVKHNDIITLDNLFFRLKMVRISKRIHTTIKQRRIYTNFIKYLNESF